MTEMLPRERNIGLMILAAGSSSRMKGSAKQLLVFGGKTLLRRAAEIGLQANFARVVVVLGTDEALCKAEIEDLPVELIVNENAASGISSSIKTGLAALSAGNCAAVLIMLCDQPLITPKLLNNLVKKYFAVGKPIVACRYDNTFGVPALFAQRLFGELMNLEADEGAKKIIKKHAAQTAFVRAPEAAFDVDTNEDYRKLLG